MIWLFLLILLFPLHLFAGFSVSGITDPASVAGITEPASVSGIASAYEEEIVCDTCSSNLILASHFENDDNIENGDPCGCSTNADKTWTMTSITYSTTQKSDGSYAAYVNDDTDNGVITATINKAAGTIIFDIYVTTYAQYTLFLSLRTDPSNEDNWIGCGNDSSGVIGCFFEGAPDLIGVSANMTNNAWHTVTFKYRTGVTNPSLSLQVDSESPATSNTDLTPITGTLSIIKINHPYGTNAAAYYIDNVKIYDAWL